MSRKLKRVPLNFPAPLNTAWPGYLNPHGKHCKKCPFCDGSGYGPEAKNMYDEWYGHVPFDPVAYGANPLTLGHPGVQAFARRNVEHSPWFYGTDAAAVDREARRLFGMWSKMWMHHLIQADVDALVKADRLWDFTRVPLNEEQKKNCHPNGWTKEPNGRIPTADEVNAWSLYGFGHDSSNCWVCVKARAKREKVVSTCEHCRGNGSLWRSKKDEKAFNAWKPKEPPKGPGYQLWENVSEGSPVSPVFKTLEELCAWCETGATTFGSNRATKEQWRKMLDEDFVCHEEKTPNGGSMIFI